MGPYRDPLGWTYTIFVAGKRKRVRCRAGLSEADARREVEDARRGIWTPPELTVAGATSEWIDMVWRRTDSRKAAEVERCALRPLAQVCGDLPVYNLAAKHVLRYLAALGAGAKPRALATQRTYFLAFTRFSKWLLRKGHCPRDAAAEALRVLDDRDEQLPWKTKSAAKRLNRGKPQLRNLTEVQAYLKAARGLDSALYRAAAGLPLLTGVSSGELRHLRVGNLDFEAGVIWIRDDEDDAEDSWEVKTANRRRSIELPPVLAADLAELADGKDATAYLFAQTRGEHKGQPRDRTWLRVLVTKVCEKAGVRMTCPHGLRGTFASATRVLAERAVAGMGGRSVSQQIGDLLGHGDRGKTAEWNYIGAPHHVASLRVIQGGATPDADPGSGPDFAHNFAHRTGSGVDNQGAEAAKG